MTDTPFPFRRVLWLTAALFLSYLAVAMSLPVISVQVGNRLGFGAGLGGLAVGIAFLATILTRGFAGRRSDLAGGKVIMRQGLVLYVLAAATGLLAEAPGLSQTGSYALLIFGRLILGLGESLTLVGMLAWGIAMAGPKSAGRFLAMMGAGMYGSFALGGPLGIALYDAFGFVGVMAACAAAPAIGLAMITAIPASQPTATGPRENFWQVVGWIWRPGAVVGLQGIGFAALGAFLALLFAERGWPHAGLGLTFFSTGFVSMRLFGDCLLSRWGGFTLTLVSLTVEALGQTFLWLATGPEVALAGAFLTGLGCSMIYPAMGADVVRIVPARMRGTAMGGFSAFQDLAYGATGPLAGLAAQDFGEPVVFLIGALAALLGLGVLLSSRRTRPATAAA